MAIADIDGDGPLDVVAVTDNGDIWVLNGKTGESLPHFPVRTGGVIRTAPLLIDLSTVRSAPRTHT